MLQTPLSQDPVDEACNSAVFVPLDASLVRKLARAQPSPTDPAAFSEPSDDESERRYSDVSAGNHKKAPRSASPQTVELIRQWDLRVRDSDSLQDSPPALRDRDRARDSAVRSFGQPASSSSNGLSPSVSRRWEETIPSGARLVDERKRSLQSSGPAFEPRRYEFYGVGQENNPGFYSTPYFALKTPRPQAVRPVAQPQKKKMSSLWKFLSGRRRPKRERRNDETAIRQSFQGSAEPIREKRDWKVESFRRLRRTGRHVTNLDELMLNERPSSQQPRRSASIDLQRRPNGRSRKTATSPGSSVTTDPLYIPQPQLLNIDSPSLGVFPGTVLHGERLGSNFDSKREANSFAGYRGRIMFTTEGSSVSSLSDREDENNVESSHLYLPRRQLRAMQYK